MRRYYILVCVVTAAAAFLLLPLFPVLTVSSQGQTLFEADASLPVCEVSFRHSVNKGIVREVYRLDPDSLGLTLETAYFQSYGAGMLDEADMLPGMSFRHEDDWFVLDFPKNPRKSVEYIGGNTAGHVFAYGGNVLDLGTQRPQKPFVISLSRRGLIIRLLRRGG